MSVLSNDIYIGSVDTPLYHFENDKIELGNTKGMFALDVIGNELSIDTFTIVVRWTEDDYYDGLEDANGDDLYASNDDELTVLISENVSTNLKDFMKELPYGTPVWWFVDEEFYTKGYLKSVDRTGKYSFKLTCTSGVGLLDTTMHVGGLYQTALITDILDSIIGTAFTYEVSAAVQASRIYGRLPYDTCRNNLHRLLFATGAALMHGDDETDYIIDYLSEDITDVPASRVALQGSVDYQLPSNRVEVTEHAYFETSGAATETLFDNSKPGDTVADNLTVIFDGPVYGLDTTGTLTYSESGVNYAVVSGQGTLTGKFYTHTTQIMVLENNPNSEPVRIRRVTENELINTLNSRNVARRVLSYYQSAKQVKAKILLDGEQCGNLIRLTDAFGDITQAYLARMDTLVTSAIGAQCQLVEGFEPGSNGNNYLHRQVIDADYILTEGNTWTVPNDIPVNENGKGTIKLVLIQGGTGGQGGYNGANGLGKANMASGTFQDGLAYAYANAQQAIPQGGAGGASGQAGKVYIVEVEVYPGDTLTFNVGVGGAGGAKNGGAGAAGTQTTVSIPNIGTKSSQSGDVTNGYFDPFTGNVYATTSDAGVRGGNGGRTDTESLYGNNGKNGFPGETIYGYAGGAGGSGVFGDMSDIMSLPLYAYAYASGGAGGGAAYGANGGAGGSASHYDRPNPWAKSGAGGAGANALPPGGVEYGCGGNGGNGGGAGGNAGAAREGHDQSGFYIYSLTIGVAGAGGQGSVGGAGGAGVGFIYY